MTDEEAFMEAAFDLSYDIADWLECAAHFFHVRFLRDEHEILWTASQCMDLRRFASLPDDDEELDNEYDYMKEPLKQILLWMRKGGVPDVPPLVVVFEQAMLLADNMRKDVREFYKYSRDPITACHRWHIKGNDGSRQVCSGTVIQNDIWTRPSLNTTCPAFLWVYNHVLLKTGNEAVVEGMCKGVSKHADSIRGLSYERYV
jgi:hypothetical protein